MIQMFVANVLKKALLKVNVCFSMVSTHAMTAPVTVLKVAAY